MDSRASLRRRKPTLNVYEGMYIFDMGAAADFSNVEKEVHRLMERAGAELLVCTRWDDRRLAYEIKGHKRGCYVLTYFKAPPEKMTALERDARLSEKILRVLFVRADGVTREQMLSPPAPGSDSPRPRGGDRWEREGRGRRREGREGREGREAGGASGRGGGLPAGEDDTKRAAAGLPKAAEAGSAEAD